MLTNDESGARGRIRVRFITDIDIVHDGNKTNYRRTHDVSMNGVFISTVKPLPIGAKGEFSMHLAFGMRRESIKGKFEVVRVVPIDEGLSDPDQGGGMGIKFVDLDPEGSELLFNVIVYNQPEEK